MDTLTILNDAFFLVLGFLIGWLAEWRYDVAYWSEYLADLRRREMARRAQATSELNVARRIAEQQLDELRSKCEAQTAELRAQANQQVAAAHAKTEALIAALKSEHEAHDAARQQEYERRLAEIRAMYGAHGAQRPAQHPWLTGGYLGLS